MPISNFKKDSDKLITLRTGNLNEFDFSEMLFRQSEVKYYDTTRYNHAEITIIDKSYCVNINGELIKIHAQLSSVANSIKEAMSILTLNDGWLEGSGKAPLPFLFQRAVKFLVKYSVDILDKYDVAIQGPEINPGIDGSIDLDWRCLGGELLINFVNDEKFKASYYGDDLSQTYEENTIAIEGHLVSDQVNEFLSLWMRKLK